MGAEARTGIDKRAVDAPVALGPLGAAGDHIADTKHHGGTDQALYVYAQEDADHWIDALGRELPPGIFGENLRTCHLDVSGALIGERWRLGAEVEVQVTAARIPCRVFSGFWDVPDLVSRFLSAGRPGAYLRVLTPGDVHVGDDVEVVARPDHDLTVADLLRIQTRDRGEARRVLAVDGVAERVRRWAEDQVEVGG